jgi:adenylylsulfate reductase subunit B
MRSIVRGYADFAPLGHSVRVDRDERKGTIAWKIVFRDGTEKNFLVAHHHEAVGTAIPSSPTFRAEQGDTRQPAPCTTSRNGSAWTRAACARSRTPGLKLKKGVYY